MVAHSLDLGTPRLGFVEFRQVWETRFARLSVEIRFGGLVRISTARKATPAKILTSRVRSLSEGAPLHWLAVVEARAGPGKK